jgi:site-specific recombinase XerD
MTDGRFVGSGHLMDAGPLQPLIGTFVAELQARRHTSLTISGYEHSARHFAGWLCRSNIDLSQVDEDVVRRFAGHRCRCPGGRRQDHVSAKYVRRVRRFLRFLADGRALATVAAPGPMRMDARIVTYQDWLRHHRGNSERTVDRHGRMITRLLPALGTDPELYDALLIRRVIIDEAKRSSRPHVKTMSTALRGYLRFLAATGLCRSGLDHAVPTIPQWRLSALPRYLPAGAVEQVIASCDLTKPHGIRDRAILLLLARLGLRAGDVLAMRLGDIAWTEGTIRVRGKGRREIRLPLPQDAGDALLEYLSRARPPADDGRVFLRSSAPYRPFKGSSVISSIVRLALTRAGIVDAPSRGANLLRHSAATSMLRAGATLDAVGTVLRHRSIDTTAHYAKVDVTTLQLIAQPWPGEAPC